MRLSLSICLLLLALNLTLTFSALGQSQPSSSTLDISPSPVDAALSAALEKYFTLYAAKDLDALMSLWSTKSPDYASFKKELQQQFLAEDDRFDAPTISGVKADADNASLRATINRTAVNLKTGQKRKQHIARNFSFVRENGQWKIWRSVSAESDLAAALVKAGSEPERTKLLAAEKDSVTASLVQALNDQGLRFYNQGNYQQALSIYDLAQALAEQIGDKVGTASALGNIGMVHARRGDFTRGLEYLKKSLALNEALDDKQGIARRLNDIGFVYYSQGDYEEVLKCLTRSLALLESLGDKAAMAAPLRSMGNVYYQRDNYRQALEYFQKSLAIEESVGNKEGLARSLGSIGIVYQVQSNYAQALDYFQRSLTISQDLGDKYTMAITLDNIGFTYGSKGDYPEASDYLQESLAIRESIGDKPGIARTLNNIGNIYYHQENYVPALEHYQKSLALRETLGTKDGIATSLSNVAKSEEKLGRYTEALDTAMKAEALARQIGNIDVLWRASLTSGYAYRALHRLAQAQVAFEETIKTIETLRAQLAGGDQAQQRYFESKVSPYYAMVDLLVAQGRPAEALSFAERAKARVLLDVLENGRVNVTKTMTSDEQDQERKLNAQLVLLNVAVQREGSRAQPDATHLTELKSQLEKARLALENFQTSLYASHHELRAQRGDAQTMKPEEVSSLSPDAASALLEYVVTGEATYLFAVGPGKPNADIQVYTLPIKRAELENEIDSFRRQLAERNLGFRASARRLYDLLLKPAQSLLRGKTNVVIVPDDKLWEVPFQALLTEDNRYLIQTSAVAYAPSLTVLREMRAHRNRREGEATNPDLLALGNPVLGKETIERAVLTTRNGKLNPLPETEAEVRALGQLYGSRHSRVYIGAEAREDRVKNEAGQARILHFATHGILNNAAPMYSYLVLAQGDKNEDGLLEARELMQLDLKADLAVLSACETARGRYGAGEGVIGLSWALFIAGVPSTVVSQWKVESASTRDLMLTFHQQLKAAGGVTKAEALRRAYLKLLKNPETSHPFYWAGFVLIGDDR